MSLTPLVARSLALVMLGGALAWSRYEMRPIPAASIPLEGLSTQIATWSCTGANARDTYGPEVKTLDITYQRSDGRKAAVIVEGTYTRLGALRDWALARSTGGWNIANETERNLPSPDGSAPVAVRLQELAKGDTREAAVSLYMSRDRYAASLGKAEVSAWRDRFVGRRTPWFGIFVTVPITGTQDREEAQNTAIELAQDLASRLKSIAAEAGSR